MRTALGRFVWAKSATHAEVGSERQATGSTRLSEPVTVVTTRCFSSLQTASEAVDGQRTIRGNKPQAANVAKSADSLSSRQRCRADRSFIRRHQFNPRFLPKHPGCMARSYSRVKLAPRSGIRAVEVHEIQISVGRIVKGIIHG